MLNSSDSSSVGTTTTTSVATTIMTPTNITTTISNNNNNTTSFTTASSSPSIASYGGPIRLNNIKGYSNRTNNIIYCPPLMQCTNKDESTAVVYFGGDVQVSSSNYCN